MSFFILSHHLFFSCIFFPDIIKSGGLRLQFYLTGRKHVLGETDEPSGCQDEGISEELS